MKEKKKCRFYRSPKNLSIGIGYCDIGNNSTMCEGDFFLCETPTDLKQSLRKGLEEAIINQASVLGIDIRGTN